jgi:hypothetical protein
MKSDSSPRLMNVSSAPYPQEPDPGTYIKRVKSSPHSHP